MAGIYGDFIEAFPELMESFYIWRQDDRSDQYLVRAIYLPGGGDAIKRRKYTSGNTGLDIKGSDDFYITESQAKNILIGDYVARPDSNEIFRLTELLPYHKAAGYRLYTVERVTGTTINKDKDLDVKEAYFA